MNFIAAFLMLIMETGDAQDAAADDSDDASSLQATEEKCFWLIHHICGNLFLG